MTILTNLNDKCVCFFRLQRVQTDWPIFVRQIGQLQSRTKLRQLLPHQVQYFCQFIGQEMVESENILMLFQYLYPIQLLNNKVTQGDNVSDLSVCQSVNPVLIITYPFNMSVLILLLKAEIRAIFVLVKHAFMSNFDL